METIPFVDRLILASDLRRMGEDARRYRRACERGQLVRIHRGVYVDAAAWRELKPSERYLTQVVGAHRASRTPRPVSHASAAALWGVPLIGAPPKLVHVLSGTATDTRTENGFRRHASAAADVDVVVLDGMPITSLARTLAEFASTALFRDAVVALDWAIRPSTERSPKLFVSKDEVSAAADRLGIVRGRRSLERAMSFADGDSGSPGESVSRVCMLQLGFPMPVLQQEFFDAFGSIGFTDFWWPEHNVIGEFDGLGKYIREDFTKGRSTAEVVIDEKKRENRLRAADGGHGMTRWDWQEAMRPPLLFERLSSAGLPSFRR